MKLGYCTTYKLGDKVKPITKDEDCPVMNICSIQLCASQNGIRETYQVDWFEEGAFRECWVECHQIKGIK